MFNVIGLFILSYQRIISASEYFWIGSDFGLSWQQSEQQNKPSQSVHFSKYFMLYGFLNFTEN